MRKPLVLLSLISMCLLIVAGCNGSSGGDEPEPSPVTPQYSVLGTWTYTLFAESEGASYEFDSGTITFEGTETGGTCTQIDFYELDYHGDYTVNGENVSFTASHIWTGAFTDATHMNGTWNSVDSADVGTWIATKQ